MITVGPVTIIKAENKKQSCHESPNKKYAAKEAPKNVVKLPSVISLVITGPMLRISDRFKVRPPSNKIILMANDTK